VEGRGYKKSPRGVETHQNSGQTRGDRNSVDELPTSWRGTCRNRQALANENVVVARRASLENVSKRTYSAEIMAFIHEGSCKCAKSELDLFSIRATQTSVESGMYVDYHPVSSITGGAPIEFDVNATGEEYLDLANSLLHVTAKIVKANGEDLQAASTVGPVNNFFHSLFS
jgi:hypothetical protein